MGSLNETNPSLWVGTTPENPYEALSDDGLTFDAIVIGAGIAGLSTALLLKRSGLQVAVLEAGRVASGTTGYTTAKVSSLHGLTYADLLKTQGEEKARQYADASQAAIEQVAGLVEEDGIDCDFERKVALTYTQDPEKVQDIESEVEAARQLGLPASFVTETELPFEIQGAVRFDNQAQFHPRKFCLGLAALIDGDGSRIFDLTRALDIDSGGDHKHLVKTDRGDLKAWQVVQATHLPFHDPAAFFSRAAPTRSYALAGRRDSGPMEGMYLGVDSPTRSVRSYTGDGVTYLVLGGESHKVGQDEDTTRRYASLEEWANRHFSGLSIDHRWSAQDYMPADEIPYIGKLAPGTEGLWTATGFKKWGMTAGTVAGMILNDLVMGRSNPWSEVFDSTRLDLTASAKKFVKENANVVKRFVGDRVAEIPDAEELQPGSGAIAMASGKKVAAFRRIDGSIQAVSPVCTHMGCLVSFNTAEKSWDCPCHGSRFDLEGKVIQGPAVEDLEQMDLGERE